MHNQSWWPSWIIDDDVSRHNFERGSSKDYLDQIKLVLFHPVVVKKIIFKDIQFLNQTEDMVVILVTGYNFRWGPPNEYHIQVWTNLTEEDQNGKKVNRWWMPNNGKAGFGNGSPPVFSGVHVTRSLVLCVCFVDCCLSFFFWPLCCLVLFDIRSLITPFVSSNYSYTNLILQRWHI